MYLEFYGFKEAPFNLTPDSKFLFLSQRHQEALAALVYGVQERKGFILLTGEIGCGKTTLCRAMLTQLDGDENKICVVLNSYLTDVELLKTINEGYGLPADSDSKKSLLDTLNKFLISEYSGGNNVILIIDESQNLRPETLEQIRMISNLETETAKLIQIILVGQPELRRTLALPELEQLNQRITVRYHIAPFTEKEIPDYINHRLSVAEPNVDVTYTELASRQIYHASRGVPRRINVICDRCLLVGYVQGEFKLDDKIVQAAVAEIKGDTQEPAPVTSVPIGSGRDLPGTIGKMMKVVSVICLAIGLIWTGQLLMSPELNDGSPLSGGDGQYGRQSVSNLPAVISESHEDARGRGPIGNSGLVDPSDSLSSSSQRQDSSVEESAFSSQSTVIPTPTPDPTPTPTPDHTPSPSPLSSPKKYRNWELDKDGGYRLHKDTVEVEKLGEAAVYLNIIRLWNISVDLDVFQSVPHDMVSRYDILSMFKQLNFEAFITDNLSEALRLNFPVIVHLESGIGMSEWISVVSSSGDSLVILDPVNGRQKRGLGGLEPHVKEAVVLYQDPRNMKGARFGNTSPRIGIIQTILAKQGYYQGPIDDKYGPLTQRAVSDFQENCGFRETGVVSSATAAVLNRLLNPDQPGLHRHEYHFTGSQPQSSELEREQEIPVNQGK